MERAQYYKITYLHFQMILEKSQYYANAEINILSTADAIPQPIPQKSDTNVERATHRSCGSVVPVNKPWKKHK